MDAEEGLVDLRVSYIGQRLRGTRRGDERRMEKSGKRIENSYVKEARCTSLGFMLP